MRLKPIVAAVILSASIPAMATLANTCTSNTSFGALGPSGGATFGNAFSQVQSFNDCYSFTLDAAANAFGLTVQWDGWSRLDIDLSSVTLSGLNLNTSLTDLSPGVFSFNGLQSGDYQLAFAGRVIDRGGNDPLLSVGYGGILTTSAITAITPVPEPESLAMLAMGFAAVAWVARRKPVQAA